MGKIELSISFKGDLAMINKVRQSIIEKIGYGYLIVNPVEIEGSIKSEIVDYNNIFKDHFNFEEDIFGMDLSIINNKQLCNYLKEVQEVLYLDNEIKKVLTIGSNSYFVRIYRHEDYIVLIFDFSNVNYLNSDQYNQTGTELLSNLPVVVYKCKFDQNWTMEYLSQGCEAVTGYKPEELIGNNLVSFNDLIIDKYKIAVRNKWIDAIENKGFVKIEYEIKTKDDMVKWVYEQGQPIFDSDDAIGYLEGIIVDISEQKKREEEINYLTYHDSMTGLFNRRYYSHILDRLSSIDKIPITVIVGDINGLKLINDAFGHELGDKLIIDTAKILQSCTRSSDIVTRTGGDEFVIFLPNTDKSIGEMVVKRILKECEDYNNSSTNSKFNISVSLGLETMYSLDEKIDDIIKYAEDYMYKNKLYNHKSTHNTIINSIRKKLSGLINEGDDSLPNIECLAESLGQELGLSKESLEKLKVLSSIHDIGKISIETDILNKVEPLTDEEWLMIKKHPEMGYRIAMASLELASIADYIISHHERWDGGGYPEGLKGDQIPLLSRIVSVLDAYDAMRTDKTYRKKLSKEEAIEEIKRNAGTQFDPEIARVFIEVVEKNYCD